MQASDAVLSVHQLSKIYPGTSVQKSFVAVDAISFQVAQGEVLGLLGPNGAGKTTIIQMLLSTLTPTSGLIYYFGKDFYKHRSECLQHIAFASTYINLPSGLTIYENLKVYGMLYGMRKSEIDQAINRLIDFFGIAFLRNRRTGSLSAGQKTRAMLCKAFLANPKIVLLDEPTASLDPDVAYDVREFIKQQQHEQKTSVLFTSHNMDEVAYVCDRILVLSSGKIIADDTPKNLAASVDVSRVHLIVDDYMEKTLSYVSDRHLPYVLNQNEIVIKIDEHKIAELLGGLARAGVHYTHISIEKPTLEDYFLKITRKQSDQNNKGKVS